MQERSVVVIKSVNNKVILHVCIYKYTQLDDASYKSLLSPL